MDTSKCWPVQQKAVLANIGQTKLYFSFSVYFYGSETQKTSEFQIAIHIMKEKTYVEYSGPPLSGVLLSTV